jgi:checkpoint serine/threonine-protein kinase
MNFSSGLQANTVFGVTGNQQADNSHLGRPRALQRLVPIQCNKVKHTTKPGGLFLVVSLIMPLHTCRIDINKPLSVYKDENSLPNQGIDKTRRKENTSWRTLGTQADRNKENNMMPTKWTCHKVFSPGY